MLPKFTIPGQSINLKTPLQALGVMALFDPNEADLSGMTSAQQLYLSAVFHQSYLSVDEYKSEAAAATAPSHNKTAPRVPVLVIDHPFLKLIREAKTGSILFMGRFCCS